MKFLETFNSSFDSLAQTFKEKSPTIAMSLGIGGFIFASVYACKKSMKLPEVITDHKEAFVEIKENTDSNGNIETTQGVITASQASLQVKTHFCWSVIKMYALPVGIGIASLGLIGWSHCELNKRYSELNNKYSKLVASYVALNELFSRYRSKVRNKYGVDAEREIRYNIKKLESEEEIVDDKGKKKKRKTYIDVIDPTEPVDDYTAFFCSSTVSPVIWNSAMIYNLNHIKLIEKWANDKLNATKKLFINDLLHDLGLKDRLSGQYIGWIKSDDPNYVGDNYVKIAVTEAKFKNPDTNVIEPGYILEFNADGNILDKAFEN